MKTPSVAQSGHYQQQQHRYAGMKYGIEHRRPRQKRQWENHFFNQVGLLGNDARRAAPAIGCRLKNEQARKELQGKVDGAVANARPTHFENVFECKGVNTQHKQGREQSPKPS